MAKKEIQLTEGRLLPNIISFVLPLMLTNLLQMLYNAADMVVVSLSTEPDSVGAIGTTGAMINLILNIFMGFSIGANVMVAQQLGEGNFRRVNRTVHTSIFISLIFGVIGCGVGLIVSRPVLALMGNSGNLLDLADLYTKIYFLGVPFLSLTNYEIAILRAQGDTKTPLYILTGTGLLNCVLNLFFVLVCGMSVDGVALATAVSNAVSAILLLIRLMRDKGAIRFSFRHLAIDKRELKGIIYVGLPAGIQGALFSLSNMIIQSSILKVNNLTVPAGSEYQPIVKGNAAAANLEGFLYTATNSVYQAAVTFTGQNLGAGKHERITGVMRNCYLVTCTIAVIFSTAFLLLRNPLLALYGVKNGAEGSLASIAYGASVTRMMIMFTTYPLLACMEVGSGILRGLGKSITSTLVSLGGSCAFRILWIETAFRLFPSLTVIYLSYPISWGLTAICHFLCSLSAKKKLAERAKMQTDALPQT